MSLKLHKMLILFMFLAAFLLPGAYSQEALIQADNESAKKESALIRVVLETNRGNIILELDQARAPLTVASFLQYVDSGFYEGTIFHRVIPDFIIQGGGHLEDMSVKETLTPVKNEANNGLSNVRGSLTLARTIDPHSGKAQFFINLVDNHRLDYRDDTPQGYGYCVFGRVSAGMELIDAIAQEPVGEKGDHWNVPLNSVIILKARRLED